VKALREKTGAGMMDCKTALVAANGDMDGAVRHLREKGLATAAKRAGKVAAEGVIAARLTADGAAGVMLELNCETDFVAKTPQFQELSAALLDAASGLDSLSGALGAEEAGLAERKLANGKRVDDAVAEAIASLGESVVARRVARLALPAGSGQVGSYVHAGGKIGVLVEVKTTATSPEIERLLRDLAMQIAAANPRYVSREQVPAAEMEREREIYRVQARTTGKPEPVIERIVDGKIVKFYEEVCLVEQEFIRDPQLSVQKLIADVASKVGAPISVTRFVRFQLGESSADAA
jgi:elongation factor Ts